MKKVVHILLFAQVALFLFAAVPVFAMSRGTDGTEADGYGTKYVSVIFVADDPRAFFLRAHTTGFEILSRVEWSVPYGYEITPWWAVQPAGPGIRFVRWELEGRTIHEPVTVVADRDMVFVAVTEAYHGECRWWNTVVELVLFPKTLVYRE